MDLMNKIFCIYLDSFMIVYIDDILVYLKSEGEHIDHFRVLYQIPKEHQLFAKYSKCEVLLRSVQFLVQIISSEGIEVDAKKIRAVKKWSRPLTPTYIRSFFALAGYYRMFMDGFACIASRFTTLTQKSVNF